MHKTSMYLLLALAGAVNAQQPAQPLPMTDEAGMPSKFEAWPPGEPAPLPEGAAAFAPVAPPSDVRFVPAIDPSAPIGAEGEAQAQFLAPPPPVNLLSGSDSVLSEREARSVATARRWIDGAPVELDLAEAGDSGRVVFRLGRSMPVVVCAPLYICAIELQPGEKVNPNGVSIGDGVRWRVTPAISGTGAFQTTHVVIKPNDIGLSTNLLIATDRRTYMLKLVSREHDWMPLVAFSYPEDEAAQWAAVARQQEAEQVATVIPETGESIGSLDFGFRVKGDKPAWRPLRVYSDGAKTYIQFPRAMQNDESPALVAIGADDKEQIVNYRMSGDRYVVDKVLDRAVLVSGVGRDQVKVKIEREGEG